MSFYVSVHLGSAHLSRQTYVLGGDVWGSVWFDADRHVGVTGSVEDLRRLADVLLECADDVDFRSAEVALSASEVARRESVRQEQRLRLLADRLERGESA